METVPTAANDMAESAKQETVVKDHCMSSANDDTATTTTIQGGSAERDIKVKVEKQPVDPWRANGEYSKLLKPGVSVYYVKDEAKLVDTGAVMRSSGKGCGMSFGFFIYVFLRVDMFF